MDYTNPTTLTAISPLDGRYWSKVSSLSPYFSEFSLIKYRVLVEIEYFIEVASFMNGKDNSNSNNNNNNNLSISAETAEKMRDWYRNFAEADALRVKEIEKTTNHDVKVSPLHRWRVIGYYNCVH